MMNVDTRNFAALHPEQVLRCAVQEQLPAILILRRGQRMERFYTGFIEATASRDQLNLSWPICERSRRPADVHVDEIVAISFRRDNRRYFLSTRVTAFGERRNPETARVVTVSWPDSVSRMQRRLYERAAPPNDTWISVGFRVYQPPLNEAGVNGFGADRSDDWSPIVTGLLEDVSGGGFRLRLPRTTDLRAGALAGCRFDDRSEGRPLEIDARIRHVHTRPDGTQSVGFELLTRPSQTRGLCSQAHLGALASRFHRLTAQSAIAIDE